MSETKAAASATYQAFTRQHFQQLDEHLAIPQVDVEVLDAAADSHQVRVDPLGECLLLHTLSLVLTQSTHTFTQLPNTTSNKHVLANISRSRCNTRAVWTKWNGLVADNFARSSRVDFIC